MEAILMGGGGEGGGKGRGNQWAPLGTRQIEIDLHRKQLVDTNGADSNEAKLAEGANDTAL